MRTCLKAFFGGGGGGGGLEMFALSSFYLWNWNSGSVLHFTCLKAFALVLELVKV